MTDHKMTDHSLLLCVERVLREMERAGGVVHRHGKWALIGQVKPKNRDAVVLGKLGGAKGGSARAAKLSAKRRTEIASRAARTRWGD